MVGDQTTNQAAKSLKKVGKKHGDGSKSGSQTLKEGRKKK
jgi:hypothetical protein